MDRGREKVELTITIELDKDTGKYMAFCKNPGVASCGDDIPEAILNIADALWVYLKTLEDLDEPWSCEPWSWETHESE